MQYYLGLDNGGSVTKAALFDVKGGEVGVASMQTRVITPRPDVVERDMEEMWQANCSVIRDVIHKSGIDPVDIIGVAVCGHGKGLYLWGKNNKPVRNGIVSTDNRAWEIVQKWRQNGVEEQIFGLTYQHILACQPVALLAWLKQNEPQTIENIKWIFECKDYIRFRLTGEARAEITDYSGANLINLNTAQYDPTLLEMFNLADLEVCLPPICRSTDICGYITQETEELTGLRAGTPVAGGMFDIDACAIAVGITNEDHICMIAGTWSINEYIRRTPVSDGSVLMNSLFCIPGYFLIEECSPTSAGNLQWFIDELLPEYKALRLSSNQNVFDELNLWVESISPQDYCPIFIPFLMGSNAHPNAKGNFIGVSNFHNRKYLTRSVFEGITFSHRYHLDKLLATRKKPPSSIRLAGGASKSATWVQMFADIMHLPVEVVEVNEAGALGCAIAASVAVGNHDNLEAAVSQMCRVKPAMQPDASQYLVYERKYDLYKKVLNALDGIWDDVQGLVENADS